MTRRYIDPADAALYHITDSLDDAIRCISDFYRVYHSQRYVDGKLIFRLNSEPSDAKLKAIDHWSAARAKKTAPVPAAEKAP